MSRLALAGLAWLAPSAARACATCFGRDAEAGLLAGLNWGIAILAGSTFLLVGGIVYGAWRIERRREELERRLEEAGR